MKCCDLYAGKLRNSIIIERETDTPNDSGGQDIVWATYKSLKAFIKPKSGTERVRGMKLESPLTHSIFIRYTADILPDDRVNFDGRYMQIRAVVNIEERNRWIELSCEEGVAQ